MVIQILWMHQISFETTTDENMDFDLQHRNPNKNNSLQTFVDIVCACDLDAYLSECCVMAEKTAWNVTMRKIMKILTVPVFLNAVEWGIYVHPMDICNGIFHCPYGDDQRLCDIEHCPLGRQCLGW